MTRPEDLGAVAGPQGDARIEDCVPGDVVAAHFGLSARQAPKGWHRCRVHSMNGKPTLADFETDGAEFVERAFEGQIVKPIQLCPTCGSTP